ncbi:MAG: hypothetical protein M1831_000937 [Alyxoria varia]|nr:MAG: hypothetical protein M1831_000937 [Alyxoria varia]
MDSSVANAPPDLNNALPGLPIYAIILLCVSTVIVSLRIYARAWLNSVAGWDDFFIVVAMIVIWGLVTTVLVGIYLGGYGRHTYYLTPAQLVLGAKTNLAFAILLSAAIFSARSSICLLLLRILSKFRLWRWVLYGVLIVNVAVFLFGSLLWGLSCVPVRKLWYPETPGHCMSLHRLDVATKAFAVFNVVEDFLCAGIPFVVIRGLQMKMRTKIGLYVVLCCGVVTAACSIGRMTAVNFESGDTSYNAVPLTYWSLAEAFGAVIFASLPALHQLWKHVRNQKTMRRTQPGARTLFPWASARFLTASSARLTRKMSSLWEGRTSKPGGSFGELDERVDPGQVGIRKTTHTYAEVIDQPPSRVHWPEIRSEHQHV